MAKQKGLGKRLGALLGEETMRAESAAEGSVSTLPLQKIEPNPLQPRRTFAQDELDALNRWRSRSCCTTSPSAVTRAVSM